MIGRAMLVAIVSLGMPAVAGAQALQCMIPSAPPQARPDLPTAKDPVRIVPVGGYTLALTWSPAYCRTHARDAAAASQCQTANKFGFTLHGLWPDGVGKEWPQYCRATPVLPEAILRGMSCTTPSAQLVQHEWAKHGTCMGTMSASEYFARSSGLYARLRYPDMNRLSRAPLSVGQFATLMARENAGMRADMIRVTADRRGWLDEVWLCLDKQYRFTRCAAHSGGLPPTASLKIWRGGR